MDEIKDICEIREVAFKPIIVAEAKEGFARDCYYNRLTVCDFFEPSEYKQIMYLDNDCLVKKDMNEMFCSNGEFVYVEEVTSSYSLWNGLLLDEKQKIQYNRGINAGTFVVPGNKFTQYIGEWKNSIFIFPSVHNWGDQNYLNYTIRNNIIPSKKLDDKFFSFVNNTNSVVEHYIGDAKRPLRKLKKMELKIKELESLSLI